MHLIDRAHKERCISFSFVLIVLLAGCLPVPQPSDAEQRIFDTWLQVSDFPQGWRAGRGVLKDEDGVVSRAKSFRASSDLEKYSVLVTHQVSVYGDGTGTSNAYTSLESVMFPTVTWVSPQQLSYRSAIAGRFRFACIPVEVSGVSAHSCKVLGQYGDIVSSLYANVFEDRWFTWEDLEHVLQVIDERMAAQMQ